MQDTDLVAMLLNESEDSECEIHIHIGRDVTVGVRRGYVGDYMRLSRENVMDCKDPTDTLHVIVRRLIGDVVNEAYKGRGDQT